MRYRCFYITDAPHIKKARETLKQNTTRKMAALTQWGFKPSEDELRVVAVESNVWAIDRKYTHPVVALSDGNEYKDIAIFDMEATPPQLVHESVPLRELRKLKAALPPMYINQHGSVVNDKGEIIMRGETEPQGIVANFSQIFMNTKMYTGDFGKVTIVPHFTLTQ